MADQLPATEPIEEDLPGFFEEHQKSIIFGVIAVVVLVFVIGGVQFISQKSLDKSQMKLAAASSPEELQAIVEENSDSMIGGHAKLLLSADLRESGDFDKSIEILETFSQENPEHPLRTTALLGLAGTNHAKGNSDKAIEIYRQISAQFSESYAAPLAMLAEARLLKADGDVEAARKLLESITADFSDRPVSSQARSDLTLFPPAPIAGKPVESVESTE